MSKKITVAANSFGGGHELVGKRAYGQAITSATRKNIVLEDGSTRLRQGTKVTFEESENEHSYRQMTKVKYDMNGYEI